MKKLLFIPAIISVLIFSSCSDEDSSSASLVEELDAESDAILESNFEDVDEIINAGMETLDQGGKIATDFILDCAVIEKDTVNKVVTIDYGDGCEGPHGRIRRGKVIIQYNERKLIPGAFRIVTLDNFFIDDVQIEGTRTVENISASLEDDPTFEITLEGGKLTFEDETTATRDANRVRTWTRASNPLLDEITVEGGASGERRDGVRYEVEILERLVYKRECRLNRVFIPVSGVKQITYGDNVAVIDYGNGECDNVVSITINGEFYSRSLRSFDN